MALMLSSIANKSQAATVLSKHRSITLTLRVVE